MCFDNDADWHASIYETEARVAADGEKLHCHECGVKFQPGEEYTYIFMQEYEECRVCEWEEAETPCEKHDYGEIYHYRRCEACSKILAAIKEVEEDEGCPPYATQPMLEELCEVFSDRRDAKRYAVRAVELYPELEKHKWIKRVLTESEN